MLRGFCILEQHILNKSGQPLKRRDQPEENSISLPVKKKPFMNRWLFIILSLLSILVISDCRAGKGIDTVYAGATLPHAELIKSGHSQYTMLIYARQVYSSIKFLDQQVQVNGDRVLVVDKLYNGTYTNTDSVIVDRQTLMPVESYSDINTSKDSFSYMGSKVSGTMLSREGDKKGVQEQVDTLFPKPLFNGLIYAETFQALTYKKGQPFYLAEYVPGHNTKFSLVNYVRDDELVIAGAKVMTKVLEVRIGKILLHYWLDDRSQEVFKVEGNFPGFDYYLLKTI